MSLNVSRETHQEADEKEKVNKRGNSKDEKMAAGGLSKDEHVPIWSRSISWSRD